MPIPGKDWNQFFPPWLHINSVCKEFTQVVFLKQGGVLGIAVPYLVMSMINTIFDHACLIVFLFMQCF